MDQPDVAHFVVPTEIARPRSPRATPPTFSIVIACYQGAATIAETLDSMIGQTLPAHEIIVCDDGSTDDLLGALAPYRDRITLLRQENRGVAAARNLGMRAATGEFIAICDADDVYVETRLAELAKLAIFRPDLDILCTSFYIEVDGRVLGQVRSGSGSFVTGDQRAEILRGNFVPGPSAIRRELLERVPGYDESLRAAEDWDFAVRLILDGARAGLVDLPLFSYRLRPGSLSSSISRLRENDIVVFAKVLARDDLTSEERADVTGRLESSRRALAVEEARDALECGARDARRCCLRVAFRSGHRTSTRLKALSSAIAPGFARRGMENDGTDARRIRYWSELIENRPSAADDALIPRDAVDD